MAGTESNGTIKIKPWEGVVKPINKMSWSVNFIGKPEKVIEALEQASANLGDQSKVEYDSAKPHLIGLVKENFGQEGLVKITAGGHGYIVDGERKQGTCIATIEIIYGLLV